MTETVMNKSALPEFLLRVLLTERVRVIEDGGIVQLIPVTENTDCTIGLRGILADCPDISVDSFLERMSADKELDL